MPGGRPPGLTVSSLCEYCVALANEGGGKIILGVTDRRPRRIVGTAAYAEPGRTEAGLHERLAHRIPVEGVNSDAGLGNVARMCPECACLAFLARRR